MGWMAKNSGGNPDAVFTLLIIAFVVVTLAIILGMFGSITVFGHVILIQKLGSFEITAYFGAILSAYVARRQGWGFRSQDVGKEEDCEDEHKNGDNGPPKI